MTLGRLLCLAVLAISLSGCGKNSIVQKIDVQTKTNDKNEQLITLEAYISLGGLRLPSLSIPIADPKNPALQIGTFNLSTTIDGFNVVGLEANANAILKNQLNTNPTLPNGNNIPVAGTGGLVSIDVGRSRIYLNASATPVLGFALVIPEFDEIGKYVPLANLFLPLPKDLGISGVAGVFTGGASQNGIGLFIALPKIAGLQVQSLASASQAGGISAKALTTSVASSIASQKPIFLVSDENSSKNQKIQSLLGKMSQKRKSLHVQ